jgi:P-type Cu+ transporter
VTLDQMLVTIAGLLAIAWAVRFWELRRTGVKVPLSPSGRQETTVVVRRVYTPDVIVVRHGSPVRLKFIRQGTAASSEEVVFPDIARRVQLHDGELVLVDFTPERAGEYEFISGTGTLRGKVIAR